MREILFRGKTKQKNWVEGNGIMQGQDCISYARWVDICNDRIRYEVIPETVGRFTGLTDKNGTKIFEGDILKPPCWHTKCSLNCVCIFAEEHTTASIQGFALYHKINDCVELVQSDEWDEFEVIGNIHDNPELLEQNL